MLTRLAAAAIFLGIGACGGGNCSQEALRHVCGLGIVEGEPQCIDGQWVAGCEPDSPQVDMRAPDLAVACEAVDGGESGLTLATGSPAACPCPFPLAGTPCAAALTCSYLYPPGTSGPLGCLAQCVPADGGGSQWIVPSCS